MSRAMPRIVHGRRGLLDRLPQGPPRNKISHRGRANGREARREDEDVCGEYDESEQRSIVAVQPAECRGYFVAGPIHGTSVPVSAVAALAGAGDGIEPRAQLLRAETIEDSPLELLRQLPALGQASLEVRAPRR